LATASKALTVKSNTARAVEARVSEVVTVNVNFAKAVKINES